MKAKITKKEERKPPISGQDKKSKTKKKKGWVSTVAGRIRKGFLFV